MVANSTAENVLGTIGTVLWCIQIIPQIIKNHRRRSTLGLSSYLFLIWAYASVPQGSYLLIEWINIPLIVQPQIFSFLALIAVGQCMYFQNGNETIGSRFSLKQTVAGVLGMAILAGGLEVAFFELGRLGKRHGTDAASQVFGIIGVIGILAGLFPQFWEIYKLKEVVGVSFVFLALDSSGALFSLLSLIFKPKFDGLAAANYIGILILEFLVFFLAIVLNPRAKRIRRKQMRRQKASSRKIPPDKNSQRRTSEQICRRTFQQVCNII
ncbi:unnamed protein product [Sympodiomycopsis kandeliae]